jgi:hypothetical protein
MLGCSTAQSLASQHQTFSNASSTLEFDAIVTEHTQCERNTHCDWLNYNYLHANFWGQIFVTEHDLLWVVARSLCAVRYMRDLYFNQIGNDHNNPACSTTGENPGRLHQNFPESDEDQNEQNSDFDLFSTDNDLK